MVVRESLNLSFLIIYSKTNRTLATFNGELKVNQRVDVCAGNRSLIEIIYIETYLGILACTSLGIPEAATGLTIVAIGRSVSTVVNEEYLVVYGIVFRFYLSNGLVDFLLCGVVL